MSIPDRLRALEERVERMESQRETVTVDIAAPVVASLTSDTDLLATREQLRLAQNENAELRARLQRIEAAARGDAP